MDDHHLNFMGRWCLPFDMRKVIDERAHTILPPLEWTPFSVRNQITRRHLQLESQLFPPFAEALRQVTGHSFDDYEWRILLGTWFRRAVRLIFNRIAVLKQSINPKNFDNLPLFTANSIELSVTRSRDMVFAASDPTWNAGLYQTLLEALDWIEPGVFDRVTWIQTADKEHFSPPVDPQASFLRSMIHKASHWVSRNADYTVVSPYLPKGDAALLMLKLGHAPQLLSPFRPVISANPDAKLRAELSAVCKISDNDLTLGAYAKLLGQILPVCFLEGLEGLHSSVDVLSYPKAPDVIFTSNNFDTDEEFKLYSVLCKRAGARYVVGQHGNNYGTSATENPFVEEEVSDSFISWGKIKLSHKHKAAFLLKYPRQNMLTHDPNGEILLIQDSVQPQIYVHDCLSEFDDYLQEQFSFVNALNFPLRELLCVRLAGLSKLMSENEYKRWRSFDPDLPIDYFERSIQVAVSQSRLVVHSYNSTGLLECLQQNIPTLGFWRDPLDQLRSQAKPAHEQLMKAGIIFETADQAAAQVNAIASDIGGWWGSELVQDARSQFCELYAHTVEDPIGHLAGLLRCERTSARNAKSNEVGKTEING